MVCDGLMEAFLKRGKWKELQKIEETIREVQKKQLSIANKICKKRW